MSAGIIDPLETVIAALAQDESLQGLIENRLAAKHRYGASWTVGQAGLGVHLESGDPDLYRPAQTVRLELRAYASSQAQAMRIWMRLVQISRETNRREVATANGPALLYALYQASGPSLLHDPELGMDVVLVFFEAVVAEGAVA